MDCHDCGRTVAPTKPANRLNRRTGRPWKHPFCNRACYDNWRRKQHLNVKARWLRFQRRIWGTAPAGRRQPQHMKAWARRSEALARDRILPGLGFAEVVDMSGLSNQFFVDFIATYRGFRVLVDVTVKLKAYVPEKAALARALWMDLFVLHVSPRDPALFFLNLMPGGRVVSRVPAVLIRQWEARHAH